MVIQTLDANPSTITPNARNQDKRDRPAFGKFNTYSPMRSRTPGDSSNNSTIIGAIPSSSGYGSSIRGVPGSLTISTMVDQQSGGSNMDCSPHNFPFLLPSLAII